MSICLATPMFNGTCTAIYTHSLMNLVTLCQQRRISIITQFHPGDSLITRARNELVELFMENNSTHLMFVDADIGFDAENVLQMHELMDNLNNPYDVMGAAYPKKTIQWDTVKLAVEKGFAAAELTNIASPFVVTAKPRTVVQKLDAPVEVAGIGTGFMMIRRDTFLRLMGALPRYKHNGRIQTNYFQANIDPESGDYLSEDYWFCLIVQQRAMKVWLCPWIKLWHVGTHHFTGSLADRGRLGVRAN